MFLTCFLFFRFEHSKPLKFLWQLIALDFKTKMNIINVVKKEKLTIFN